MKYLTLLLIVFLLSIASCHLFDSASKPELPPITMTGKNTFGCLINGKVWLPTGKYMVPPINVYANAASLQWGARTKSDGFTFFLRSPILTNHSYDLRDTATVRVTYGLNSANTYCGYEPYQISKGTVIISRWDLTNRVFAGTFDFNTYNSYCRSDTIKVTQGRFDISDITF